jgi:hypothetical protein
VVAVTIGATLGVVLTSVASTAGVIVALPTSVVVDSAFFAGVVPLEEVLSLVPLPPPHAVKSAQHRTKIID